MAQAVLLDIDGTLIDNNQLHVLAWLRAFRKAGFVLDADSVLYRVGMGGDRLPEDVLPNADKAALDRARELHGEEYSGKRLIEHSEPFDQAAELIRALMSRGLLVALASSAKQEEVDHYLQFLGGAEAVTAVVNSADVGSTKPAPDVFAVALKKLGNPESAVVLGDTVYDIEAAARLGLPCAGVLSGGIPGERLRAAGAAAVFDGTADVLRRLDEFLALARAPEHATS